MSLVSITSYLCGTGGLRYLDHEVLQRTELPLRRTPGAVGRVGGGRQMHQPVIHCWR
ncbi:hypothetical protein [Streptomyces sp. DSM 40750]|uniref:hypothetical protein n=1 Tax=Streptomyces sp. DSM 40750 TaxID=2801030 RepID=UPI00214D07A5|nr:hypothetical protein [Streptomyces sp. DSM 40750]UUU19332.1 hypothetical protein JIX55_02855 [Streptomyces sp. DSM 40750]UUU27325.1 hypothetical protein JIX55_47895 [Streptomyces sp. DSM 40750]